MNNVTELRPWTVADEDAFEAMVQRRNEWFAQHDTRLRDALGNVGFSFCDYHDMANRLKPYADELIEALKPFSSKGP